MQHPAFVEDHDVAAQHQGLGRLGGRIHHDSGSFPENFLKLHPKFFPKFVVKVDQRLVQWKALDLPETSAADDIVEEAVAPEPAAEEVVEPTEAEETE